MAADRWPRLGKGRMIYLDYQATTPIAPEVAKAMEPWLEDKFANPHSPSRWGHEAAAAIEVARKQVDKALGLKGGSVAFTGSATEALNWALKGTVEKARKGRNRIITVATEHAAVLDTCEWLAEQGIDLTILPVRPDGRLDLDLLERELDERVLLVSIMMVNNEIGVRQPLTAISEMVHKVGAIMLSDAVQAFGRVELCNGPDLVAVSAHKIHGPKGIGALWMRKGKEPEPLIHGGGQEKGFVRAPCRRCYASGSARRRSSPTNVAHATMTTFRSCGRPRSRNWAMAGSSMGASSIAIQAISTFAAKALMRHG